MFGSVVVVVPPNPSGIVNVCAPMLSIVDLPPVIDGNAGSVGKLFAVLETTGGELGPGRNVPSGKIQSSVVISVFTAANSDWPCTDPARCKGYTGFGRECLPSYSPMRTETPRTLAAIHAA